MKSQKKASGWLLLGSLVLVLGFLAPIPEYGRVYYAGTRPEFGIRSGYDFKLEAWALGAQLRLPLGRYSPVLFVPSADILLVSGHDGWQANLDLIYRSYWIYGGVGVAFLNWNFSGGGNFETRTGYNLFTGFKFTYSRSRVQPYGEMRWTHVSNLNCFRLSFGLNLALSR